MRRDLRRFANSSIIARIKLAGAYTMYMPISSRDIIQVPIKSKWVDDAMNYALISWTQTFNRTGTNNIYKRVERIVIGKMSEDATLSALQDARIEFDLKGCTDWHKIDQYDLKVGNFDIDVKSNFIDINSKYIANKYDQSSIQAKLDWYLKCQAIVPTDQLASSRGSKKKKFLFVFTEGHFRQLDTLSESDCATWVHMFWDYLWLKKADYKQSRSAGRLRISYDAEPNGDSIIIYGTQREKKALVLEVPLIRGESITSTSFHQVFSVRFKGKRPTGVLTISSDNLGISEVIGCSTNFQTSGNKEKLTIVQNDWHGFELEKSTSYILGWATDEVFRIDGELFKRYSKDIEQYEELKMDNFGIAVVDLNPVSTL